MTGDSGRALEAVLKLAALEERTAGLKGQLERIEGKLESLIQHLAQLEGRYAQLANDREAGTPIAQLPEELPVADTEATRPFLTSFSEE